MDTNQVGSINFDANALYLEEESEHELDDKQQDNEIKELISQGGLDGILDDESLMSSSGDSSYDDDDQDPRQSHRQKLINSNEIIANSEINKAKSPSDSSVNSTEMHKNNNDDLFSPKHSQMNAAMPPPSSVQMATPLVGHQLNSNFALNDYRNQFSTPSANQMPPLPSAQMLQATVIPNICEEKIFYQRQRQLQQQQENAINNEETANKYQPGSTVAVQQTHYQATNNNDPNQLLNYTNQFEVLNANNYMQIQQQHYVHNAKLHSMERFGLVSSNGSSSSSSSTAATVASTATQLMPNPIPQRLMTAEISHDPHEHLTNDHELSLNETDNEDMDLEHQQQQQQQQHNYHVLHRKDAYIDPVTPITTVNSNNLNINSAANSKPYTYGNGIQLEFSGGGNQIADEKPKKYEQETSVIDLNELDEEQLEQLKMEEDKQQKEYFNMDNLNRQYCQTLFLYKVRGKKLEETKNLFATYQEDAAKEIRAMKHRLSMAEQEKQQLQTSLDQAHDLCQQYKTDMDLSAQAAREIQEKCDKLKQTNRALEQKLQENDQIIDNLQMQIGEQQKLDTMERIQEQHEHFIQQLRDQYEKDMFQMKEKVSELQSDLNEKQNMIHMLRIQLDTAGKNAEMAAVERAETVNRLTRNLSELQSKYDQDVLIAQLNQGKKLHISPLINNQEDHTAQLEELRAEIQRLTCLCDELERDKCEMTNDLMEKNGKLDQMMEQEEEYQKIKNSLELDIYSKQQHIMECEKVINELHHANSQDMSRQQMCNEYEAQLGEFKLKLTNREHEIQKIKQMYMDVCSEKNNLQDSIKSQYDTEYEKKLKQRLDACLTDKLEEQKAVLTEHWQIERTSFNDEHRRKCDIFLADLKELREQLNTSEKQCDQIRLDKANLELKSNRIETDLKEKCILLERTISELNLEGEKRSKMLQETEIRLNSEITKLRSEQSQSVLNIQQLETQLNSLESQNMQLINEKENLMQTIELTISERDKLQAECDRLTNELDELNRKNSLDSNRLIDLESRLQRSDQEMKDLENKLEHTGKLLSKSKSDHDHQIKSLEEQLIAKYESILDEGHRDFDAKKKEFIETKTKLEFRLADNQKEITSLKNDLEQCKLAWNKEKKELISKQDEEFENNVKELEKRFQEDYSLFMQTHKESIQRTLNEKTQEFTREKESLIEIYEKKIADLESNEKSLLQKIREFRSPAPAPIVHKPRLLEVKCQTDPTDDSAEEEIEQLLNKIRTLEDTIAHADAHFEQEVDKLRQDLEEDYQLKLERSELNQRQLEHEIDILRNRLPSSSSNSNSSENSSITNETTDFDLIYSTTNHGHSHSKYAKLKQELNLKEKELETVGEAYRLKFEQLQEKYDQNVKQMQAKYDTDLNRCRIELNENYKQTLNKSKHEIEQMQTFVQKLKKTNSDSDRVIDSLKQEMAKMKEAHLDEITGMKLCNEREKENLKEKYEIAQKRIAESEDHLRKQLDLLRAELKQEYGSELSRMNAKMKDMMKSHSQAVDLLKKQHHSVNKPTNAYHSHKTCQTETSVKDIELLETFRQRYLDTVTRMKSDMMKHFDAQTQRNLERLQRQLSDERTLISERIQQILMPKIVELLREFQVSETLIDLKICELEKDLLQISQFSTSSSCLLASKKKANNDLSSSSSSSIKSRANSPISSLANNYINSLTSPRPSSKTVTDLYSKSATNMRELSHHSTKPKSTDSTDNLIENHQQQQSSRKSIINSSCGGGSGSGTGYKYTPLRQSWSNLSQMNQLSPSYSITSSSSSSANANENNLRMHLKSPRLLQQQLSQASNISTDKKNIVFKSQDALDEEKKDNENDEDYVYFNDNETATNAGESTNFNYKKYRGQNIRQKKIKSSTGPILDQNDRPRSASSLLLIQSQQNKSSQSDLYSSASQSNLNPISTLYEISKNYKSIRQLEEDDNQQSKLTNGKSSSLVSRSSIQLSNCVLGMDDDERPVKELGQQHLMNEPTKTKPTLRSATTVTNNGGLTLPRPTSNLSIKTKTSSSISTTSTSSTTSTTSSRPRSRTPTSSCSSLLNDQQQSYLKPTLASVSREVSNQIGSKAANLSTSSSTQYLPINTQSFQKKRTIF